MRVYEAKIQYHLVQEGPQEVLNRAEKIVEYMQGAFDEAPVAEMFYVVCLTRKNRPLGRHRVTVGTATAALAQPSPVPAQVGTQLPGHAHEMHADQR